jgi:hypothetical protein
VLLFVNCNGTEVFTLWKADVFFFEETRGMVSIAAVAHYFGLPWVPVECEPSF